MISLFRILLVCCLLTGLASADERSEIEKRIDDLFIKASNPEAHHQHLVDPSREELAAMGDTAIPRLVLKLSTDDAREKHALANIFKRIGSPAVPALIEALDTEHLDQLRNTARCLGEIGDKSATHALLGLFGHDNHTVRSGAVTAVGRCHDSSAVSDCIVMLQDKTEPVRKSAAVALGRIADSRAASSLIEVLDDSHFSVRMSSVRALTAIGDPACESLIASVDSMSQTASYLAYEVWAASEYRPARKILEQATNAENKFRRGFAILALAAVDPGKAEKRIKKMLKTETDLFVLSRIHAARDLLESAAD
jgi:hypothetical protein